MSSTKNNLQDASARQTVLIVDDTPENLTVLGELLQPYYRVRVASSGARALAASVTAPRPDLILLDVMMPEMDGYAVLSRLRDNPETSSIPVIFVTALDATDDEMRGLELGAADYITKPVRPTIVLARVRGQLELKQARDRMRDENAWLEAEVTRRMRENEMIQDVSMRALASLAETRDNETGNHILRTQGYVEVLCRQMASTGKHPEALSEKHIKLITKAAPLHDIGKVGVPDHILLKPGKLTDDEWVVMRQHAAMGAEALRRALHGQADKTPFEFLQTAMDIARYHHEKWDGSGYPEGLKGNAIPLSARLMALADVFDAIINRRVYKAPMTMEAAVAIIHDGRGTHFDPDVVDAFAARLDDFRNIAERFSERAGEL
jgi:putative two-component system response regulator